MLDVEQVLDDELSPFQGKYPHLDQAEVRLIYPHWRSGTLPLSARTRHLFPTAYEAPRVRFMLVDGETKGTFPGWVVREKRYVHGLQEWYESHGVIPGSIIKVRKGEQPGQVIVQADNRRPSRDWIRTLLVGSDGGMVFAMLKQIVSTPVDDRMAIAIPDKKALDPLWQTPIERSAAVRAGGCEYCARTRPAQSAKPCSHQRTLFGHQRHAPLPSRADPGIAGFQTVVYPCWRPALSPE